MRPKNSIWLAIAALAISAFIGSTAKVMAADKSAFDPTGTWKLTTISPGTKTRSQESTLKLKLEGEKLTGTIDGRSSINGKVKIFTWPITDAKLQGNDISFTVTHPPVAGSGPDSTTIYEGKITGATIKGTADTEWNGSRFKRDFEAKRVKEQGP